MRIGANAVSGGVGGGASVTVTACAPSTGVLGDTLTITGTNFAVGQAVLCGGVSMGSITVVSGTSITATIPSGVSGLLAVSVAGVTLNDAVTITSAILFHADWSTATGTGSSALRDTAKALPWDTDYSDGGSHLSVVDATGLGMTTTNCLRVRRWSADATRAWVQANNLWSAPATGNSLYFRTYLRVDMATAGGSEDSHHPCESYFGASGGSTSGKVFDWHFNPVGGGQFDLHFRVDNVGNADYKFALLTSGGSRTRFNTGETYRLEWSLTRTSADHYTVAIRVYDGAGTLMSGGGSDWRSVFGGTYYLVDRTPLAIDDNRVTMLRLGSNGGTWSNVSAEYFYWAGVAVRSDTWCGSYAGGV